MYEFIVSEHLQEILKKLSKRDKNLHEQIMKKIREVINSPDVEHYKNLQRDLKDSKRVHIGHFVLVFKFNKSTNLIIFDDFDHHDNIYKD